MECKDKNNFIKHDKGKLRYDLIPPEVNKELAKVFTYGAELHGDENWKKCDDLNRYIAALIRHLEAYRSGEIYDKESGLLHMSHVLINAAFMTYFLVNENELEKK